MKTIGVLSGMGPQAGVTFYNMLIQKSRALGARRNKDYPHIILSNLPVPDLIETKDDEEHAVRMIECEAKLLAEAGADFLVLACNTMHVYIDRFQKAANRPFLSMIDAVCRRIQEDEEKTVGILGTPLTIASKLYAIPLERAHISVIDPSVLDQEILVGIIQATIAGRAGDYEKNCLAGCIERLGQRGAKAIILGCTELPLLLPLKTRFPLYDSLAVLAESACQYINA